MFERAKFYSVNDLSVGVHLIRVEEILENYKCNAEYSDINDVLELYNVKLFIDNDLALRSWDEEKRKRFAGVVKNFLKDISTFLKNYLSEEYENGIFDKICYEYQQDFWDVIENFNLVDCLKVDLLEQILSVYPKQIGNVLHCKKIVNKHDDFLGSFLTSYPMACPLLVNAFLISDSSLSFRKLYIPKSLGIEQRKSIVVSYLDNEGADINVVRTIIASKGTEDLHLDNKTRLKARKLEQKLKDAIMRKSKASTIEMGFSIELSSELSIPPVRIYEEGPYIKYVYSEKHLDTLSEVGLLNTFKSLFAYFDGQGVLNLCYNQREDVVPENLGACEVKGTYRTNIIFRMKNAVAIGQLQILNSYLHKGGRTIEEIMKFYYESYFGEKYSYPAFSLNFPNDQDSYINKNKIIAPEMESIVKQYDLFVESNKIDPELYGLKESLPITLAKSKLKGRHKYVIINENHKEIHNAMYMLFSDQSLLNHVNPFKESRYETLYNLLTNETNVKYSNYADYQKPYIDYLIKSGYLINQGDILKFGNPAAITVLYKLHTKGEISYHHCTKEEKNEIAEMIKKDWLKYDDYLLSPNERHFINYYLNASEYSNGLQLRNKYSHGMASCIMSDAEHMHAYNIFLMIFVIYLLKMDEDMELSASLGEI